MFWPGCAIVPAIIMMMPSAVVLSWSLMLCGPSAPITVTVLVSPLKPRSARKVYWALVAGVPKPRQGRVSTFLAKEEREDDSVMRIAQHGDEGASHAITYYAVVETAARQLAWLSLKPVTDMSCGQRNPARASTS